MKNLISLLLYLIVILIYLIVDKFPPLFIWLAWTVGYFKNDIYSLFNDKNNP